jgi:hypothetical protein
MIRPPVPVSFNATGVADGFPETNAFRLERFRLSSVSSAAIAWSSRRRCLFSSDTSSPISNACPSPPQTLL